MAIKPALINTNQTTSLWIYANARNWLHFSLDILKDHYLECRERTQTSILAGSRNRWEEAWQVEIKWGRKKLKTLQELTIELASQAVTTFMVEKENTR